MLHVCEMGFGNILFFFQLTQGIRQGGVLSPYLFAVYVDDAITTVEHKRIGCYYKSVSVSIIMYADDIVLLSPSVTALQQLKGSVKEPNILI